MSSLKNAIKRRTHKERSQPLSRSHLGLLEKKKDYKERAKQYQEKQEALKLLRKQAEERNPDEFYFAMEHQQTQDGIHIGGDTRGKPQELTDIQKKLLKSKDLSYILSKMQAERKKIERLQASLHFLESKQKPSQHIVFVDEEEEAREFEPEEYFDTSADMLGRTFNRPRNEQLQERKKWVLTGQVQDNLTNEEKQQAAQQYKELEARQERYEQLRKLVEVLEMEKQIMGKGTRKLVKDSNGSERYVWAKERKK
eukprot:TRINITY_DN3724_c2_g2_i1.p1 TRINITY_DN3724_c2_g2~~TRINITY_DN3724_c2_g2_i1.p1  ORF type:complete len:290 (-),score=28.41 TRINITY_DN3724_c2_g2_i1:363-1124(-)